NVFEPAERINAIGPRSVETNQFILASGFLQNDSSFVFIHRWTVENATARFSRGHVSRDRIVTSAPLIWPIHRQFVPRKKDRAFAFADFGGTAADIRDIELAFCRDATIERDKRIRVKLQRQWLPYRNIADDEARALH